MKASEQLENVRKVMGDQFIKDIGGEDSRPASCSPCLVCGREWPDDSEQVKAIVTRGKCIVCIVEAGERIEMNPYEFSVANAEVCQPSDENRS